MSNRKTMKILFSWFLIPSEIKYYLGQNYEILVEIEEVDYFDTDFSRASHRLSLAEITEIVKYQSMDNV